MKEELIISSQAPKKFVVEWEFNPHLILIILIEFTTQEWH
jgi:hypothetical protein